MDEDILYSVADGVGTITLNRPQARNALTFGMYERLAAICSDLPGHGAPKVLVFTGAGEKAFVAGADINELAVMSPFEGKEHAATGQRAFDTIETLGKPVVAAVNGFALGGGCELAMSCTLRIAADTARFRALAVLAVSLARARATAAMTVPCQVRKSLAETSPPTTCLT